MPHDLALSSIELCAGVGMLGEGFRAACEFRGIEHRTVCYVEREAPAAGQLVALMEAGALDPAPVWPDLLTFDGDAWRGKVDCIVAGFPCQDISIAGRRAGLDGKRSGLFFDILDLADHCGAWLLSLENVSAIATATASVVDETEGELDERAAARVVGELADRGWDAEWITLSASDVGASHGRARWFCLAWRVADTRCRDAQRGEHFAGASRTAPEHQTGGGPMAHASDERYSRGAPAGREAIGRPEHAIELVADTTGRRWAELARADQRRFPQPDGRDFGQRALAIATGNGWNEGRAESGGQQGRPDATECGCSMADTSSPGREGREQCGTHIGHWGGQEAHGPTSQLRGALPLFAPGPTDPRWAGIIAERPDLAPAVESGVRMLVDELALLVDESRNHQLRQVGNGVVPAQAAVAFVVLARRAGIFNFARPARLAA